MKKTILAFGLSLGILAAPALYACDYHKSGEKSINQTDATDSGKATKYRAKSKKSKKAVETTVEKKGDANKS
jgi:hypothetical protein